MADRKRELETNQLAAWLNRIVTEYGTALKLGGAALAVLALAYLIFQVMAASERHRLAKSWEEYLVATSPEDYEKIIQEYKGYRVELWALLDLADAYYSEALGSLAYEREQALTRMKQALELYQRAAAEADRYPDIARQVKSRALLGAAQCQETLGQRDKALELYKQLVEEFPKTWVAQRAQEKIEQLSSPGAAEFYRQLSQLQVAAPSTGSESLLPPLPGTQSGQAEDDAERPQPEQASPEEPQEKSEEASGTTGDTQEKTPAESARPESSSKANPQEAPDSP